jgi:hypothetical protein
VRQWKAAQLGRRKVDQLRRGYARRCHRRIMVYNDDTVARRVHVELDRVCTELDRTQKCRYRILRQRLVCPAVRDAFSFGVSAQLSQGSSEW